MNCRLLDTHCLPCRGPPNGKKEYPLSYEDTIYAVIDVGRDGTHRVFCGFYNFNGGTCDASLNSEYCTHATNKYSHGNR